MLPLKVVKFQDIDLSKLKLGKVESYIGNRLIVPISLSSQNQLLVQTSKLFVPFSPFQSNLKLSFQNIDFDPEQKEFYRFLIQLGIKIKSDLKTHLEWKPIIHKNQYYADYIYSYLPQHTKIYNQDKSINHQLITPCYIKTIMSFDHIWISDTNVGLSTTLHQVRLYPNSKLIRLPDYSFLDDDILNSKLSEDNSKEGNNDIKQKLNNQLTSFFQNKNINKPDDKYQKMRQLGISEEAIQHKIKMETLDTPISTIKINPGMLSGISLKKVDKEQVIKDKLKHKLERQARQTGCNPFSLMEINPKMLAGISLKKVDKEQVEKDKLKHKLEMESKQTGWRPPSLMEIQNILTKMKEKKEISQYDKSKCQ